MENILHTPLLGYIPERHKLSKLLSRPKISITLNTEKKNAENLPEKIFYRKKYSIGLKVLFFFGGKGCKVS